MQDAITIELTGKNSYVSGGLDEITYKTSELVNEDGTVTSDFWDAWKIAKWELKKAGFGVRKVDGKWIIPNLIK